MHMQFKVDPDDALALPSFRSLYSLTAVVALLVGLDLLFWWFGYEGLRNPLGVNLSLIAAVLGGARIVNGALLGLMEGDVGADLALAVAMVAAIVLGEYWVAAEVVLIAMFGESLEAVTFARTHREVHKILELRPRSVRVRRDDREIEIPVDEARVGDVVIIRPGERIPVDGTVLVGRSSIDQSTLTGESLPIDKGEGDAVYTGTLNQFGALEVQADKVGEDTTLSHVIQLVAQAQQHKAPIERTADRFARYFLPMVMACAAATFVYSNWAAVGQAIRGAPAHWTWMPTLAVLVVACPCALILATPAAVMASLAWLAKRGVLIKGGIALERLAAVNRIAFDKTGTLTQGKLRLGDVVTFDGASEKQVLRLAAAAEQSSEHLIARVIVKSAEHRGLKLPPVYDFLAQPGAGVVAHVAAETESDLAGRLLVGNRRLVDEQGLDIPPAVDDALAGLESTAQTPLLVCRDDRIYGVIGVRDTVRDEAADVVRQLRELGIDEIVLLTGDREAAAAQVAGAVGIDHYEAELRPEEKAQWLAAWRNEHVPPTQETPHKVAMVGDGVNDAPALASADVGLALGGVGSDVAAEAGDLVLMGDPLSPLPGLLQLSRETVRVIRQNILLFAFFVNVLGIVLTGWIMPSWSPAWRDRAPVAAAVFHQIGSVLVLLNAMRLLWFEQWRDSLLGRAEDWLAQCFTGLTGPLEPLGSAVSVMWARRRSIAVATLGMAALGYVATGLRVIRTDEVAVVQRCGRLVDVLRPGLHLRLPPPWETVRRIQPEMIRTIEIGLRTVRSDDRATAGAVEWTSPHREGVFERREEEAILLTGDENLVELGAAIQYRLRTSELPELKAYLFSVRNVEAILRSLSEGVIRRAVATHPLLVDTSEADNSMEILTAGRDGLQQEIGRRLQHRVDAYGMGIEILPGGVCLQDVHPPLDVVGAFRNVSRAYKKMGRMKNEADRDYRAKVIEAGGPTAWRILDGRDTEVTEEIWKQLAARLEGEAAQRVNLANAEVLLEQAIADGRAAAFLRQQEAYVGNAELSRWRMYLDKIADALRGKRKLILDAGASGRRHLFLGVPEALVPLTSPSAPSEFSPFGEPGEQH